MRSRGVTLLELLLVLVLTTLLVAIGLPRLVGWRDRFTAEAAAALVATMLDRGRSTAIRLARPVDVERNGGTVQVVAVLDTGRTPTATRALPAGVTLIGLDRAIRFGAEGLAAGASNRTLVVRVGTHQRQVVVSRLGRIR